MDPQNDFNIVLQQLLKEHDKDGGEEGADEHPSGARAGMN